MLKCLGERACDLLKVHTMRRGNVIINLLKGLSHYAIPENIQYPPQRGMEFPGGGGGGGVGSVRPKTFKENI